MRGGTWRVGAARRGAPIAGCGVASGESGESGPRRWVARAGSRAGPAAGRAQAGTARVGRYGTGSSRYVPMEVVLFLIHPLAAPTLHGKAKSARRSNRDQAPVSARSGTGATRRGRGRGGIRRDTSGYGAIRRGETGRDRVGRGETRRGGTGRDGAEQAGNMIEGVVGGRRLQGVGAGGGGGAGAGAARGALDVYPWR